MASSAATSSAASARPAAPTFSSRKVRRLVPGMGTMSSPLNLNPGEGAAFEILVRNASIAGRTAHLNVGGFLYTNRDSLSLGYVLPLDNLKKHYRGDHSHLLEWMKSRSEERRVGKECRSRWSPYH